MTSEQKELLLKDLCARLPYGVWIERKLKSCKFGAKCMLNAHDISAIEREQYEFCKPYLFPLSSMTEEQKNELSKYLDANVFVKNEISFWSLFAANMMDKWKMVFEWCNKNHFDINGLIPMGLALDATGLNIY